MAHITLDVKGMTCHHCKMAVTGVLETIEGVSEVKIDLNHGTAAVDYNADKVNVDQMKRAVEAQGYDVE